MRYVRIVTVVLFVLTLAAWLATTFIIKQNEDTVKPVITADKAEIQVSVNDGPEALLKGLKATDDKDGDITDKIIIGKQSRFIKKGISDVTYLVFDSHNNVGKYTRKVEYTDYTSPKFNLSKPLVYNVGVPVTILDRLTVKDSVEGDISNKIKVVSSNGNSQEEGVYNIGVEVTNRFGDTVSVELPVSVIKFDRTAPILNLENYLVYHKAGSSFNPNDYLINAVLENGEDVDKEKIQVTDNVDTSAPGVYQVIYAYTDERGITGYTGLTVIVEE